MIGYSGWTPLKIFGVVYLGWKISNELYYMYQNLRSRHQLKQLLLIVHDSGSLGQVQSRLDCVVPRDRVIVPLRLISREALTCVTDLSWQLTAHHCRLYHHLPESDHARVLQHLETSIGEMYRSLVYFRIDSALKLINLTSLALWIVTVPIK